LAEEQRLAYVALSRAEQTLLITWSKGRNDPRFPDREPSRFLGPLQAVLAEIAQRNAPATGEQRRRRLDAIRRELEAATPVVEDSPTVLGR
jgi:ATP-dependent exoDNAse (exonuclease V) beta subunit